MEKSITNPDIFNINTENSQDVTNEESNAEKSQWLPQFLENNPQILSFRERILPLTGGYSFSNLTSAANTASLTPVNRFILLQLIYNHLYSIGMFQTAEKMKQETGLNFQIIDQPWFRTHLSILISLGVLPNENPWKIKKDSLTIYAEDNFDEDYLSSTYQEDPNLYNLELNDPNLNAVFSEQQNDYQHLVSCSLRRLVVLLAFDQCNKFQYNLETQQSKTKPKSKSKSKNFFITGSELKGLFLILHSITTSKHFLDHLKSFFHITLPSNPPLNDKENQARLRISVLQIIQKWVLFRGLFIGNETIKRIKEFIEDVIKSDIDLEFSYDSEQDPTDYRSFLTEFLEKVECLKSGIYNNEALSKKIFEQPIIKDPQLMFKPGLKFTEPDSMETARQITLITHKMLQKVHSREIMIAFLQKKYDQVLCPYLVDLIQFSNRFSRLTLELILLSNDRNDTFTKVIEIASNLDTLFNYQILSDLLKNLLRSEILSIVQATQSQISTLKDLQAKCGDVPNFFNEYSKSMLKRNTQMKPAIPNFNAELREANFSPITDFTERKIDIEKRRIIAEKLLLIYSFQNNEYLFIPIQQIQKTIMAAPSLSNDNLEKTIVNAWLTANDFNS